MLYYIKSYENLIFKQNRLIHMTIALVFFPLTETLHLTCPIKEYVHYSFIHQILLSVPYMPNPAIGA